MIFYVYVYTCEEKTQKWKNGQKIKANSSEQQNYSLERNI